MMTKRIFIASVCLNIGLGVGWAWLAQSRQSASPVQDAPMLVRNASRPAASNRVDIVITNQLKTDFTWSQLESEDYKKYIENLRAVGCPELTIYDIIISELDLIYEPKLNALKGANIPLEDKFWLKDKPKPGRAASANEEIKKLEEERRNIIKDLLGLTEKSWRVAHNYYEDSGQTRYSYLTEEQRLQLEKIEYRYEKQGGTLRQGIGYANEEEHKKMLVEMKAFMSPEQIMEYEIRTSNLSKELRNNLKAASPSEEEFRKIFTATYEARNLGPADESKEPPTKEQMIAAQKQAQETLKETLGEERYAEMQRARDYSYRQLVSAAPFLGYDKAAAVRVYGMRNDTMNAIQTINANAALTPEQKGKAIMDINVAVQKAIVTELGEKGANYYLKSGGSWMRGGN